MRVNFAFGVSAIAFLFAACSGETTAGFVNPDGGVTGDGGGGAGTGTGGQTATGGAQGSIGAECYPNNTCNTGLACVAGRCQRPNNATGGAPNTGGKTSSGGGGATNGGSANTGGAPGGLGAECYPNGTCNSGLVCIGNVCFAGTGGVTSTGGMPNTGGTPVTGGVPNTGGVPDTGGAPATGGAAPGGSPNTGGAPVTGGAPNTGGTPVTGGAPNTGGAPVTGGAPNTGGAPVTGGAPNTGGAPVTGGAPNTGGSSGNGGGSCVPPAGLGICDTIPQCGCDTGQNCDVTITDGTTDCIAAGTTALGRACDDLGQCQVGSTCIAGACWAFCENESATCPGINTHCLPVNDGTSNIPGLFACSRGCYPVNPTQEDATWDSCGPGVGCYPTPDSGSYCAGPTTPGGTQGADCFDLNVQPDDTLCAPGYFCDADLLCKKFCLRATPVCPNLLTCYGFSGRPMIAGGQEIGACDF